MQQQAGGLVAKLIGFGPLAEDMDNPSDKSGAGVSLLTYLLSYCIKQLAVTLKRHVIAYCTFSYIRLQLFD